MNSQAMDNWNTTYLCAGDFSVLGERVLIVLEVSTHYSELKSANPLKISSPLAILLARISGSGLRAMGLQ